MTPLDLQGLLVSLLDAFSYALTTALAILGLCVVAVVAWKAVIR